MSLVRHITKPTFTLHRSLFYWINLQFNQVDEERKQLLGADRTCAEWILRNGGKVRYSKNGMESVTDYNVLPKEKDGVKIRLIEVDASETQVMHNGFEHFKGCQHITKTTFDSCPYLNDACMEALRHLQNSLTDLQISRCEEVSDKGILSLTILKKLRNLVLSDLRKVKDKEKVLETLKNNIPQCSIKWDK